MRFVITLLAFAAALLLAGCHSAADDPADPTPGTATRKFIRVDVQVNGSRGSRAVTDEDDGYTAADADLREATVTRVSIILWPHDAGTDINGDAAALATRVHAYSWPVRRTDDAAATATTYTTDSRQLPDEVEEGDYNMLVVANADLTADLDGATLAQVRDYTLRELPLTALSTGDNRYSFDPLRTKDFVMSSVAVNTISLMAAASEDDDPRTPKGSEHNPFTADSPVTVERLACRIDMALRPDYYHETIDAVTGEVTDRYYEYPVTDAVTKQKVGTFKLTHVTPFNITHQEYLFKHTTVGTDLADGQRVVQVPGREVQDAAGRNVNYVIDPYTLVQGTNVSVVGSFYNADTYHSNLGDNAADLRTRYRVPRLAYTTRLTDWTNAAGEALKYYTLTYSAENSITADAQQAVTTPLSTYASGIRFYGSYQLDGSTQERSVPFDYFIRHSAPALDADLTRPMTYGLVRNNIYRVYIRSVSRLKDDFVISLSVQVLPWAYYVHDEIWM